MSEAFATQLTNLASEGLVKFFAIPTSLSTFPVGVSRTQYQQKSHDFWQSYSTKGCFPVQRSSYVRAR